MNKPKDSDNEKKPISINEQKTIIKKIFQQHRPPKENSIWCIIEQKWYNDWLNYVNFYENPKFQTSENNLRSIDNNNLIFAPDKLKRSLRQGIDYSVVPLEIWNFFQKWFGCKTNDIIQRKVVKNKVDVFPFFLKLKLENEKLFQTIKFSGNLLFCNFSKEIENHFQLKNESYNLWLAIKSKPYKLLNFQTLSTSKLKKIFKRVYDQEIIIILKNSNTNNIMKNSLKFQVQYKFSKDIFVNSHYKFHSSDLRGGKPHEILGVCGFKNFGNTCYMNSALQCLTKCKSIVEYFLKDEYVKDLKKKNRRIASSFSKIMKEIWSGEFGFIYPRECKFVIGKYDRRFLGYGQQDSSEFVTIFLAGLHEDLKKVVDDEKEKSDKVILKKSNNSIIVQKFHGQFRNEMFCKSCSDESIKFESFMNLCLPIPTQTEIDIRYYKNANIEGPVVYKIKINKDETVNKVVERIAKLRNVFPLNVILAHVNKKRIIKVYDGMMEARKIVGKNNYAFEIEGLKKEEKLIFVDIFQRENYGDPDPFIISFLPKVTTSKEVFDKCYEYMKRYVKKMLLYDFEYNKELRDSIFCKGEYKLIDDIEPPLFTLNHYVNEGDKKIKANEIFYNKDLIQFTGNDRYEIRLTISTSTFRNCYDGKEFYNIKRRRISSEDSKESFELEELIKYFSKKEELTSFCEKCKKLVKKSKKIDIWNLPETLIITLKRFKVDEYERKKIDCLVKFPFELEFSELSGNSEKYGKNSGKYSLFGVVNHIGKLFGGHYTTNIKFKDKWINFNNETCKETKKVESSDVYMLFYEKM